jgi:4-amino-4-deoxy-L-arabinose transferase-like glycosyltransferase
MSRVAHWIQNGSLRHYPTGYYPQLTHPYWAELSILNLFLLWGSDRLANLVQWFAVLFSFVGISFLVRLLGIGRKGQWAALAFAASIPMGLLQATSTQNDYVAALWLICLGIFVLLAIKHAPRWLEIASLGAALGLGMLTKGTFYPYAIPLGIVLFIGWFIRSLKRNLRCTLAQAVTIMLIAGTLNLGYWVRNTISFGGPLGPADWVNTMTTKSSGTTSLVSAVSRNFLMNFVTPYEGLNDRMLKGYKGPFRRVILAWQTFILYGAGTTRTWLAIRCICSWCWEQYC